MPIRHHACLIVACDVCGFELEDSEESIVHFRSEADARRTARYCRWTALSGSRFLCTKRDANHQAAIDGELPPEPMSQFPGQIAIDGEVSE